jgi:hypothetical protein
METLKYAYKPKITTMAFGVLFFGACSVWGYHMAASNDRGLIIDGLISLDTGQATVFHWGIFAAAAMMALLGLLALVKGMTSTHALVMDETAIRFPKWGLGDRIVTIRYRDIMAMSILQVKSTRMLMIQYTGGKASIGQGMLPSPAIFDKVCDTLAERVESARHAAHF